MPLLLGPQRLDNMEATLAELLVSHRVVLERLKKLEAEVGQSSRTLEAEQQAVIESLEEEEIAESETSEAGWSLWSAATSLRQRVKSVEEYEFSGTVWDAMMCVGQPSIGHGASCLLILLAAMTILIQLTFCKLVQMSFTENPYDEETQLAFRWWRADIAHRVTEVSVNSYQSLAARTCNFDKGLPSSFSQATSAEALFDYGFAFDSPGFIMCVLALVAWFSTMLAEIGYLLSFTAALLSVSRGKTVFHEDKGTVVLHSLSYCRLVVVLATILLRAVVLVYVLYYGTLYLVYTEEVKDLLLNAVALKFVLDVAALFYEAFAPLRARSFTSRLSPIPIRGIAEYNCGGLLGPVIMLFALGLLLVVCNYTYVAPALEKRHAIWDNLCGGQTNFAVATDGLGRVHWSYTSKYSDGSALVDGTYITEAVESLSRGAKQDLNSTASIAIYEPSLDTLLHTIDDQTVIQAGGVRPCMNSDADANQDTWLHVGRKILHMVTLNKSIQSCSDVRDYCASVDIRGIRSRQWCPHTCGCSDMHSGLLLTNVANGCPLACAQDLSSLESSVPCEETWQLQHSKYAAGAQTLFGQPGYELPHLQRLANQISVSGCAAVASAGHAGRDLCIGQSQSLGGTSQIRFRGVMALCPVACGCDGSGLPGQKLNLSAHRPKVDRLELRGVCPEQRDLNLSQFASAGRTASGAPVYDSKGLFLYHGPGCNVGDQGSRWILSTALCVSGYYLGYTVDADASQPPASAKWSLDCKGRGWQKVTLTLSSVTNLQANDTWSVKEALQIKGLCRQQQGISGEVFRYWGGTAKNTPVYRGTGGTFLYYGPHCDSGSVANRWIISPGVCTSGFFTAYVESEDSLRPPAAGTWTVSCKEAGWMTLPLNISKVLDFGQLKTPRGFCLQAWEKGVLLLPCEAFGDAQQWTYDFVNGRLQTRMGACLDVALASSSPVVSICNESKPTQKWIYDRDTNQLKLNEDTCLDAAQPDTVGGHVQVFPCHVGNANQIWQFSHD